MTRFWKFLEKILLELYYVLHDNARRFLLFLGEFYYNSNDGIKLIIIFLDFKANLVCEG